MANNERPSIGKSTKGNKPLFPIGMVLTICCQQANVSKHFCGFGERNPVFSPVCQVFAHVPVEFQRHVAFPR